MSRNVASAVFETRAEAEAAIDDLRKAGIGENAISVISKHDEAFERAHDHHDGDDHHHREADTKASGAGKGLAIGAGTGAVAGLAALAIPGVAPFFAAGAVAEALGIVGSTAATSAVVGGAIGGLTGALMKYGVAEDDARYFDEHLQRGGYWVGVDLDDSRASGSEVETILYRHGGHTSGRPRDTHDRNMPAGAAGTHSTRTDHVDRHDVGGTAPAGTAGNGPGRDRQRGTIPRDPTLR
ncbi:general stress protein [Erythrobacter sp. NFXS35]|uniref:general stress protein n=1 Tax=Erythrobacter sp. NFXS35 TaxID=2818436 RepID=UPI0032DFD6D0